MAIKKFTVREGFTFHVSDDAGDHAYAEGDTLDLPEEIGNTTHQLELADPKAREKAAKKEDAEFARQAEEAARQNDANKWAEQQSAAANAEPEPTETVSEAIPAEVAADTSNT